MGKIIVGCGDVGKRIASRVLLNEPDAHISAVVQSTQSAKLCDELGLNTIHIDLDKKFEPLQLNISELYYLVPPQKSGVVDRRTEAFLESLDVTAVNIEKVVLISTTGVYGDHQGEWVTEESAPNPQTLRAKRRLDMEQQWLEWADKNRVCITVLRAPGIYANSRIPIERIKRGTPVVRKEECGFTNRIHADDLAMVAISAMSFMTDVASSATNNKHIYNVTDGTPGTISEYLQAAARIAGLPSLPEITMAEAQTQLSDGMLSYLSESRKISNAKMLNELNIRLQYPDFRVGLAH